MLNVRGEVPDDWMSHWFKPEIDVSEVNSLPKIETATGASAFFDGLRKLSKKGKLAGFLHERGSTRAIADAHGTPFDSDLIIEHDGSVVRFSLSLRKKMPMIFALILVLTVWPGLPLTDSFLYSFSWYERLMSGMIQTWMWYLPLTVIPIPFVLRTSIRKSRTSAYEHALESIEKIRAIST